MEEIESSEKQEFSWSLSAFFQCPEKCPFELSSVCSFCLLTKICSCGSWELFGIVFLERTLFFPILTGWNQRPWEIFSFFSSYVAPNWKLLYVWFECHIPLVWEMSFCFLIFRNEIFRNNYILNWQAKKLTINSKWDIQNWSQPEVMNVSSFIYTPLLCLQGCCLQVFHMAMRWLNRDEALLFSRITSYVTEDGWQETWNFFTCLAFLSPFLWFLWALY